ncbi:hypothetical protein LB503_003754 [Fusarium chuoi]|nr:hypothetical protein LB503_003754 [Fusarium chuoi]
MAIYSSVPPPEQQAASNTPTPAATNPPLAALHVHSPPTPVKNGSIDIDAWTVSALESLSVSPIARGTGTPLAIPLDEVVKDKSNSPGRNVNFDEDEAPISTLRRPPSRRDSQRKRDLVLKGKEGSRQRRRWENGMALSLIRKRSELGSASFCVAAY